MLRYLLILTLFIVSCHTPSEQEKLQSDITGNWLLVYPDHQLKNALQEDIYNRAMQDSVLNEKGLKLVQFLEDGTFRQLDKPEQKGKWAISGDKKVYIANGGTGFEDFKTDFTKYEDKTLQLTEYLQAEGESIKLVWFFRKVDKPDLFNKKNNEWRKKPASSESEKQIKERLSAICKYYSNYFELVAKESSFFLGTRVKMPMRFYQHAIGLLPFDPNSEFASLFFSVDEAKQAYSYLDKSIRDLHDKFPYGQNFVKEYADFLFLIGKDLGNS